MNISITKAEILNEVERRLSTESSIMPDKYDLIWTNTNKKDLLEGYWIEGCESVVSLFKRYLTSPTVEHSLNSSTNNSTLSIKATMPARYDDNLNGSVSTDVKMMIACNIVYRWLSAILPEVAEKYNSEANGYMESVREKLTYRVDPEAKWDSPGNDSESINGGEVALSTPKTDDVQVKQLWECCCKARLR